MQWCIWNGIKVLGMEKRMKYENAKDVLPPELLAEVQKVAGGKLLYVPIAEEAKGWGTESGYRKKLLKRNQTIYNEYIAGKTVMELADEFFLSTDSIKKIVYGKKTEFIAFEPTLSCAVQYSEAGLAEEWIRAYCVRCQPQVVPLLQNYVHFGVVKMPLRLIEVPAIVGNVTLADAQIVRDTLTVQVTTFSPVGEMPTGRQVVGAEGNANPEDTEKQVLEAPLLVRYLQGKFYLLGQEREFLSLKANKVNAYPVFILITDRTEYQRFMKNFGKHFLQTKS